MIITQWTCDTCGTQVETSREGPSTPMGIYIPKAYLRTPAAKKEDELKEANDFWFCSTCIDQDDDRIGLVVLAKLRGPKALRSVTTLTQGEDPA